MAGRDAGFDRADYDTSWFADDKVTDLWRACQGDEAAFDRACRVFKATVLGSWRAGRRLPAEKAQPAYLLGDVSTSVELLMGVGLLDKRHQLVSRTWIKWVTPAQNRRSDARERQRRHRQRRREGETEQDSHGDVTRDSDVTNARQPTNQPTNQRAGRGRGRDDEAERENERLAAHAYRLHQDAERLRQRNEERDRRNQP